MLWVGWSSKMGSHVTPALVLFQSPPEAVPTKMTSGSLCGTAMAVTRPLIVPGPMWRTFSASTSASTGSSAASAEADLDWAVAVVAVSAAVATKKAHDANAVLARCNVRKPSKEKGEMDIVMVECSWVVRAEAAP